MTSETVEECSQILRDWIEREAQMVSSLVFSRPLAATPRSSNAIKELQAQLAQEVQRLHNRLSSELKLSAAAAQSDWRTDDVTGRRSNGRRAENAQKKAASQEMRLSSSLVCLRTL